MKLFGNFRWLALISGALIMALVCWAFWPESQGSIPTPVEKIIVTRTDSTGIQALRDSLAIFKASSLKVHIKRRMEKQITPSGSTEVVYLDSSAAYSDTIVITEVSHDTIYAHVVDSIYQKENFSSKKKKNAVVAALYYDQSRTPGIRIAYDRVLAGPLVLEARGAYQDSLEVGLGAGIKYRIFTLSAQGRNYGFGLDLGYKIELQIKSEF